MVQGGNQNADIGGPYCLYLAVKVQADLQPLLRTSGMLFSSAVSYSADPRSNLRTQKARGKQAFGALGTQFKAAQGAGAKNEIYGLLSDAERTIFDRAVEIVFNKLTCARD